MRVGNYLHYSLCAGYKYLLGKSISSSGGRVLLYVRVSHWPSYLISTRVSYHTFIQAVVKHCSECYREASINIISLYHPAIQVTKVCHHLHKYALCLLVVGLVVVGV